VRARRLRQRAVGSGLAHAISRLALHPHTRTRSTSCPALAPPTRTRHLSPLLDDAARTSRTPAPPRTRISALRRAARAARRASLQP
jgi:hypothetical protein